MSYLALPRLDHAWASKAKSYSTPPFFTLVTDGVENVVALTKLGMVLQLIKSVVFAAAL